MQGFFPKQSGINPRGKILQVAAIEDIYAGDLVYYTPSLGNISVVYISNISVIWRSGYHASDQISCSADGSIVAVVRDSAPYVFRWDGSQFTPINLSQNPPGSVYSVAVSPSGRYLCFGTFTSPYFFAYEYINGAYVSRGLDTNPGYLPFGMKFRGDFAVALGFNNTYGPLVYVPGETFNRLSPDAYASSAHYLLDWYSDTEFRISNISSTYYTIHKYLLVNGQLIRGEAWISTACNVLLCYNPYLDLFAITEEVTPAFRVIRPHSRITYTKFKFSGASGCTYTPYGFIINVGSAMYEYVQGTDITTMDFQITTALIGSNIRQIASTQDRKTLFANIDNYLAVLKYVPGVIYATKRPAPIGVQTPYIGIALEDIPRFSTGKIAIVG